MNYALARPAAMLVLAAALALGGCGGAAGNDAAATGEPPLAGARIGGPFALTDQNGRGVTQASWPGKYRIMYFGFTYCPDICPTDLQVLGAALKRLDARAPAVTAKLVPIMVTVDPARDTPAVMKTYLAAFDPRFVGLTGSQEAIATTAKAYGVYFARRDNPGGDYLMDHSNQAYLMAPDGAPIALLPTDRGAEAVAAELTRWVR